jgi:hypothetical protein
MKYSITIISDLTEILTYDSCINFYQMLSKLIYSGHDIVCKLDGQIIYQN